MLSFDESKVTLQELMSFECDAFVLVTFFVKRRADIIEHSFCRSNVAVMNPFIISITNGYF